MQSGHEIWDHKANIMAGMKDCGYRRKPLEIVVLSRTESLRRFGISRPLRKFAMGRS